MQSYNFITVLWTVFDAFYSAGQFLISKLTGPLLGPNVVQFLDNALAVVNLDDFVFSLLLIDSFSDVTLLWGLGVGFFAVITYSFVIWILNIIT